jgi:hypothetical protein
MCLASHLNSASTHFLVVMDGFMNFLNYRFHNPQNCFAGPYCVHHETSQIDGGLKVTFTIPEDRPAVAGFGILKLEFNIKRHTCFRFFQSDLELDDAPLDYSTDLGEDS